MHTILLNRRTIIAAAAGLPWLGAHAQVSDLGDAINKAGRQRMLSQRMGKAWLALVHGIEKSTAQSALDKSMTRPGRPTRRHWWAVPPHASMPPPC